MTQRECGYRRGAGGAAVCHRKRISCGIRSSQNIPGGEWEHDHSPATLPFFSPHPALVDARGIKSPSDKTVRRGFIASSYRCLFLCFFASILFYTSVLFLQLAKTIELLLRQLLLPRRLRRSVAVAGRRRGSSVRGGGCGEDNRRRSSDGARCGINDVG